VPHDDWVVHSELARHPGQVVGERSHRVRLTGCVTFAVAAEVHSDDAVILGEAIKLRSPEAPMARHSMHEDERWIPAARFLVAKSHSVTNQPRHARQSA
jgi:hypothetical protein